MILRVLVVSGNPIYFVRNFFLILILREQKGVDSAYTYYFKAFHISEGSGPRRYLCVLLQKSKACNQMSKIIEVFAFRIKPLP